MEEKKRSTNSCSIACWHKTTTFYLKCLKSLIHFSKDKFDLYLHSDGSLSQSDEDFIHAELNDKVKNFQLQA